MQESSIDVEQVTYTAYWLSELDVTFESGRDVCDLFTVVFTEALCASWSVSSCPELQSRYHKLI